MMHLNIGKDGWTFKGTADELRLTVSLLMEQQPPPDRADAGTLFAKEWRDSAHAARQEAATHKANAETLARDLAGMRTERGNLATSTAAGHRDAVYCRLADGTELARDAAGDWTRRPEVEAQHRPSEPLGPVLPESDARRALESARDSATGERRYTWEGVLAAFDYAHSQAKAYMDACSYEDGEDTVCMSPGKVRAELERLRALDKSRPGAALSEGAEVGQGAAQPRTQEVTMKDARLRVERALRPWVGGTPASKEDVRDVFEGLGDWLTVRLAEE